MRRHPLVLLLVQAAPLGAAAPSFGSALRDALLLDREARFDEAFKDFSVLANGKRPAVPPCSGA